MVTFWNEQAALALPGTPIRVKIILKMALYLHVLFPPIFFFSIAEKTKAPSITSNAYVKKCIHPT